VTLVGPGGAGKTRLAVESARRSTKSIDVEQWMVDLVAVPEGGDVLAATADALGSADHSIASIAARVEGRPTLIVLDNAEHVIRSTRRLATQLLSSCAGLALLVTSREPLSVAGEFVIRVSGFVGDETDEAVELFRERATAARGGVAPAATDDKLIRRMSRMLDGLPLALELAAGRTDVLSMEELASALDHGEQLPGGAFEDQRHASLENTIRSSTDGLDDLELTLLIELSGFAGPFTLDAVAQVCTPSTRPLRDLALSLARKSLIAVDETEDGQRRYRLLESMKAFVRPLSRSPHDEEWELRHRTYFASLVDELAPAVHTHAAAAAHMLLDTLAPDLQLATDRAITAGDRDMALRLAAGQAWHWFKRGWLAEGRAIIDRALAIQQSSDPAIEAGALVGGVNLAYQSGDAEAAFEYVRVGIERATEGNDRLSLARLLAYAAYGRSLFGELEESERMMAEAMSHARDAPDWLRAELYMSQGQTLRALNKRSLALDSLARAQSLARQSGNAWALTSSEYVAGKVLIEVKRPAEAVRLLARGARSAASAGDFPGALALLHLLGGATALLEEHALGATIFGAVDAIGRRYSYNPVDAEGTDARVHRERVSAGLLPRDNEAAYERGTRLSLAELLALSSRVGRSSR
jgi:predicted ATPase